MDKQVSRQTINRVCAFSTGLVLSACGSLFLVLEWPIALLAGLFVYRAHQRRPEGDPFGRLAAFVFGFTASKLFLWGIFLAGVVKYWWLIAFVPSGLFLVGIGLGWMYDFVKKAPKLGMA